MPEDLDLDRWTVHSMGWRRTDNFVILSQDDGDWRVRKRPPQGMGWEVDLVLPRAQCNGLAEVALWVDKNYLL